MSVKYSNKAIEPDEIWNNVLHPSCIRAGMIKAPGDSPLVGLQIGGEGRCVRIGLTRDEAKALMEGLSDILNSLQEMYDESEYIIED